MDEAITKGESGTPNARGDIRPGTLLGAFCVSFCTVLVALTLLPTPGPLHPSAACRADAVPSPRPERTRTERIATADGAEASIAVPGLCRTA